MLAAHRTWLLPTLAIIVLLGGGPARAAEPDFARRLPLELKGWKRPPQPQTYDAKTLYEYIDGGAELYISFGLERVQAFFYEKGKDREIKVDVFDMGSSHNAFGIFAHGRERVEADFGQGSEYAGGLLSFWKDRYYVSILGYPETDESRAVVLALGREIEKLVPRTGSLPPIVGLLPRADILPASVRYIRHHVWLNSAFFVAHDNLLGVGKQAPAALARYAPAGGKHVLVVVEHVDAKQAEAARRTFAARYLGDAQATIAKVKERWAGIQVSGRRLVVVLDAPSRAAVERALKTVRVP